jgi:hypothetical protein
MLVRTAAVVTLLALTLALSAVARASGSPNQAPTTQSCTGVGCQPAEEPAGAGLIPTAAPQRENEDQAGYALCGLLAVLLVSIPVALVWQRNVRQKAMAAVGQQAEVAPGPRRI